MADHRHSCFPHIRINALFDTPFIPDFGLDHHGISKIVAAGPIWNDAFGEFTQKVMLPP